MMMTIMFMLEKKIARKFKETRHFSFASKAPRSSRIS